MKLLIVTMGHTASGKTSISTYLSKKLDIKYISEGKIKRSLVDNYTYKDSLNEELRDKGYTIACEKVVYLFETENIIILDASYHKQKRREELYKKLKARYNDVVILWLYCYCDDKNKVSFRIANRKKQIKNCDNQADNIAVYQHIMSTFEPFDPKIIKKYFEYGIIKINTNTNMIDNYFISSENRINLVFILEEIKKYLYEKRDFYG